MVDARRHGFHFPLLAALLILGSAWLFLGVLEDVATGDPLGEVDVVVHGVLQKLRTPSMDRALFRLYLGVHWAADVIAGAELGHKAIGLERAAEVAVLARAHSGCVVWGRR